MSDKVTIENIHGEPVTVTAAQIGDLIATLQALPQAMENSDDDTDHTMGALRSRLEEMGVTFDRRDLPGHKAEVGNTP